MGPMPTAPTPSRRPRLVHVEEVERLTPGMVRIVFGGEQLAGFEAGAFTDHYVKLQFPPPDAPYAPPFDVEDVKRRLPREQWPRIRSFTVRGWDPERLRLTIDFVVHGTGVAGPWAAAARPGDALQLVGPGGAYAPDPAAAWHLLVGDACVIPAIAVSLERIPPGVPVHVLVQIDDDAERQPLPTPGDARIAWVRDEDELLARLEALPFPDGTVHAFIHGEAAMVRAVRRHLLADRGVPRSALSASGYWKRTLTDEAWRAIKRDWNAAVEQDVPA